MPPLTSWIRAELGFLERIRFHGGAATIPCPSADIVTSSLKTNLPAHIAFRLPSHYDSMTILDQPGAENLLGRGDMLFLSEGKVERLQGFYISPDELSRYLDRCETGDYVF